MLLSYEDALSKLLTHAPVTDTHAVPFEQALGCVLAQPIIADRHQPPFHRSAMDGYAVNIDTIQAGQPVPVVDTIPAGAAPTPGVDHSQGATRIATGAAVPEQYDTVIPIEQTTTHHPATTTTTVTTQHHAFSHPSTVIFSENGRPLPKRGYAIHPCGADAKQGDTLVPAGTRLRPQHIALAASCGQTTLTVHKPVRIIMLTTGDEIRTPDTNTADLTPQQIRNSNGPMITALLAHLYAGQAATLIRHEHIQDEPQTTLNAAQRALSEADLILTMGGVSVGDRDLLPKTWAKLGADTNAPSHIHGVAIQPGKPLFATTTTPGSAPAPGSTTAPGSVTGNPTGSQHKNSPANRCVQILGLPGNPVSSLAVFHLFVWPLIDQMTGGNGQLPWQPVALQIDPNHPIKTNSKRRIFRPTTTVTTTAPAPERQHKNLSANKTLAPNFDQTGANLRHAQIIPWQGSGDLTHTSTMDGFVALPLTDSGFTSNDQPTVMFLPAIGSL